VTVTPAQHFSSRSPFDRNRALWGGFLLALGGHRVYFAGDSGYGAHFREIGARLAPIDLALVPIGAYEPRWFMRPIHVTPEEAVEAHVDVGAARSVAMHHGVFRLTTEPIDEPARRLVAAVAARGLLPDAFQAVEPGESVTLARRR
jgi:N-acyl-phosphatidylethanolamine-hydrolysing phospholipase D